MQGAAGSFWHECVGTCIRKRERAADVFLHHHGPECWKTFRQGLITDLHLHARINLMGFWALGVVPSIDLARSYDCRLSISSPLHVAL
jgi:hypothetical protein